MTDDFGFTVGGSNAQGASAGNFSGVLFQPSAHTKLRIHRLLIMNFDAAATFAYSIRMLDAKAVAQLSNGSVNARPFTNLTPDSAGETRIGQIRPVLCTGGITPGFGVFDYILGPGKTEQLVFDELPDQVRRGLELRGDDPGSLPGLLVVNTTANLQCVAGFIGREIPL